MCNAGNAPNFFFIAISLSLINTHDLSELKFVFLFNYNGLLLIIIIQKYSKYIYIITKTASISINIFSLLAHLINFKIVTHFGHKKKLFLSYIKKILHSFFPAS